jgi:hypothetical protein
MRLQDLAEIHSGYIARGKIESVAEGSHYLVQAKDVDGGLLTCTPDAFMRFNPKLSRTDRLLQENDLLFMAKGAHNFTIQLGRLPEPVLAAACFFIVRVSTTDILPGYLCWYLNQSPVARYLVQYSGRGVHMPVVRRAVLENIEVPVPPMDVQINIDALNALMLKEMNLLQRLGAKRRELIAMACLQAVRNH